MAYLEMNFNVECQPEYLKFIFQSLRDKFNDEDMKYGFKTLFHEKTQDKWNKEFGYGGKPAVADWVNLFQRRGIEARARLKEREEFLAIEKMNKKRILAIKNVTNIANIKDEELLLT